MSNSQRALSAYRSALRATKVAFNNDIQTLTAARIRMKEEMKSEKSLSNPEFNNIQRVELLEQISEFLKRNIVQGVKNDESKYTLNIHKDTELGDNDDIKVKKSTLKAGGMTGGGCCGGGKIELNEKH